MHPPDWHCSQMLRHAEIPIHHAGSSEGGAAMPYGMLRHAFAHTPGIRWRGASRRCLTARFPLPSDLDGSAWPAPDGHPGAISCAANMVTIGAIRSRVPLLVDAGDQARFWLNWAPKPTAFKKG